ncbi:MAG: NAD-dependent epimerase/dehydratase family protein [Bacteroidales bacterium]|nr:NAD-dependent epimerase/dehydratase family protein [Bacteroidales bacterium]
MKRILVIGAGGQIGSELVVKLRGIYGNENIVSADLKDDVCPILKETGLFEQLNITDAQRLADIVKKHNIDAIVNFAAILSAVGECHPMLAWNVNINGFINVMEVARELKLKQVLTPSSIAAFGPSTPRENTPQETILRPTTMYGITKVSGELLADYYVKKYGLDVRGLRYPGIISHETMPGGGTTDYAVAIYFDAVQKGKYTCFVNENTRLPMMYMPDCLKATIDLMQADFANLKHHGDFNVGAMSFSAKELADAVAKRVPGFEIEYKPDYRQAIADSWPMSIDDSAAREEWGWKPSYNLEAMSDDMINAIKEKIRTGKLGC